MQFNFTSLLPLFMGTAKRAFEFHPVDPDSGRVAVAVFFLPRVVRIPKCLEISVVGLLFLHGELTDRVCPNFKRNLNRFRIFDCSGNLMSADRWPIESPVSGFNLALWMPNLNESSRSGGALNGSHTDSHDVVSGREFLW